MSIEGEGAWVFGDLTGTGRELTELTALRRTADFQWGQLETTPDVDNDGWEDFAVTQVSATKGNVFANHVVLLSGKTGAIIRILESPRGFIGGLTFASAQKNDWLYFGCPGHADAPGKNVVDGTLWRWELRAETALPELVKVDLERAGHMLFVNELEERLPDSFGETVRSFQVGGRVYLAIADSGQIPGAVYTFDAVSEKVERRIEGSTASPGGGDWLFGKEFWGPIDGTETEFVVHAATAHGMGRIVIMDFATGQSKAVISRKLGEVNDLDTSK